MADERLGELWKVLEFFNHLHFLVIRRIEQHLAKREIAAFPATSVYAKFCGYICSSI